MAALDHDAELGKLFNALKREIFWIVILIILRNAAVYSRRKDLPGVTGAYLVKKQETDEPYYSGSAHDVKKRSYDHRIYKESDEDFDIVVFNLSQFPLIVRQAVEALLKLLLCPIESKDNHKARMTEERINALRYLLHLWIDDNGPMIIKFFLKKTRPLPEVKMVESSFFSSWENRPGPHGKKMTFIVIGEKPEKKANKDKQGKQKKESKNVGKQGNGE